MKSFFLVIFINAIVFVIGFFLANYFCYRLYFESEIKEKPTPLVDTHIPQFNLLYPKYIVIPYTDLTNLFNDKNNINQGRKPVGLEYKSKPILIFGDSFAHGQYLNPNQNFGYKLSQLLKRPVYNRAIPGSGFQHMYFQVSPTYSDEFFKVIPKTDDVIYIMILDHYLRMLIFSDFSVIGDNFHVRYSWKNNKLVMDDYNSKWLNFLKNSYLIKAINLKYLSFTIGCPLFAERYTQKALIYFLETRKSLEQHWNNKIKFTVILYENKPIAYKSLLKQKLLENNFNVIETSELTNEDLDTGIYLMPENLHPTEAAWDLLTPKIAERL